MRDNQRRSAVLAVALWGVLLAALLGAAASGWVAERDRGEFLTRNTIRLALVFYTVAVVLMPGLTFADWAAATGKGRLVRCCWLLGLLAYLIHLGMAFHYYHHWSHQHAVERTEEVSGFAGGIYFSHLFTLLWYADALYWVWRPEGYARRPVWLGVALHSYMVFIIFNSTVVFGAGWVKWGGVAMLALVGGAVVGQRGRLWRTLAARATS